MSYDGPVQVGQVWEHATGPRKGRRVGIAICLSDKMAMRAVDSGRLSYVRTSVLRSKAYRLVGEVPAHPQDAETRLEPDDLFRAARFVVETFRQDEARGYHTKDREFAITLLSRFTDAALRAPAPPPQAWQLIESAPKDGTRLLLATSEWVADGQYRQDRWWTTYPPMVGSRPQYDDAERTAQTPTHWMPLPAPPRTDEEPTP